MRTEGASSGSLIDAVHFTDKCEMNETRKALDENPDGTLSVQTAAGSLNMPVSSADGFPPRNILMC